MREVGVKLSTPVLAHPHTRSTGNLGHSPIRKAGGSLPYGTGKESPLTSGSDEIQDGIDDPPVIDARSAGESEWVK